MARTRNAPASDAIVSFAKTARLLDANHPLEALTVHPYIYEHKFGLIARDLIDPPWLEIGDDVWISHNATITPGCKKIGRGAVIGAGAVVTADVEPYAVMVGLPARRLRWRFDDATIAAIEVSRWWELDKAGLGALLKAEPETVYHPTPERLAAIRRN